MNWKFWKKEEIKVKDELKFPCSDNTCLVRAACTKACDKLIMDNTTLREAFERDEVCPDCGCQNFMEGPHGGGAVNVMCRGCGHWFNWALPLFIERIHIGENGTFYR